MKQTGLFILLPTLIIVISSCADKHHAQNVQPSTCTEKTINRMKYAHGFSIEELELSTFITVFNPWKEGDTLATYLLSKNLIEKKTHKADFIIQVPVTRVASLSATFIGMFSLLGVSDEISASTDAWLIYDSTLYARYLNNKLDNLGESMQINLEAIIGHSPQLVMKYLYNADRSTDKRIADAGIPIAYNLEYLEEHPLGRAEWIKFVAAFFDKQKLADSIFTEIEKSYIHYSGLIPADIKKPSILAGSSYKGTWYAPGGRSFAAKLFADAGGDYYWKDDLNKGSIPLSFETIIDKQAEADIWIGPSSGSKKELLALENRCTILKSFRTGQIFFFGKRVNPNGGHDYYESGVVRPDLLLQDLISVFHPQLLRPDYKRVYLEKVK